MMKDSNFVESLVFFVLMRLFTGRGGLLCVYVDAGFDLAPCVITPYRRIGASKSERRTNKKMSQLRVSIEWGFKDVVNNFAFCDYPKDLKLDKQAVGALWRVAALLHNCRSCFYGNEASQYFEMDPPDLEVYLA